MADRHRFCGTIAGLGTTSGVRIVVGWWSRSPWGEFADVMLAESDGTRRLLAPNREVAEFVSATYTFDDVVEAPVQIVRSASTVELRCGDLVLDYDVGARTLLGHALRLVPPRVATAPSWTRVTDPVARATLRGVRTRGSAGRMRFETYGATDHRRIDRVSGTWRGADLGALAPVRPEPMFGFGSTPRTPSQTSLVTTVTVRAGRPQ